MATLSSSLKSLETGQTRVTSASDLANKYILLFDASGNVSGKVNASDIITWAGGSSSSTSSTT